VLYVRTVKFDVTRTLEKNLVLSTNNAYPFETDELVFGDERDHFPAPRARPWLGGGRMGVPACGPASSGRDLPAFQMNT